MARDPDRWAVQRGACHRVRRRARPARLTQGNPLHIGFVGGCLGFSSGTSDTYVSPMMDIPREA